MAKLTIMLEQRRVQVRRVTKDYEVEDRIASQMTGDALDAWARFSIAPMIPAAEWGDWKTETSDVTLVPHTREMPE